MKKATDRENAAAKRKLQAKTSLKSDGLREISLEKRVAEFLAAAKKEKTLSAFARELGIPKQSLARYLKAEQSMTLATLKKIGTALGASLEEILGKEYRRIFPKS